MESLISIINRWPIFRELLRPSRFRDGKLNSNTYIVGKEMESLIFQLTDQANEASISKGVIETHKCRRFCIE